MTPSWQGLRAGARRPGFIGLVALAVIAILAVALWLATSGSVQQMTGLCIRAVQWLVTQGKALVASLRTR